MFNYYDNRNIKRIEHVHQSQKASEELINKIVKGVDYLNSYHQWRVESKGDVSQHQQ
jgi:hypothetical protein